MRCKLFLKRSLCSAHLSLFAFFYVLYGHSNLYASSPRDLQEEGNKKIVILSTDIHPFNEYLEEISKDRLVAIFPAGKVRADTASVYGQLVPVKIYYDSGQVDNIVSKIEKESGISRIIGYGEFDILRAARLRDHLSLPGQNYQSALAYRDKLMMKKKLLDAGILVPRFASVTSPCDLLEFVQTTCFPVVLKHRRGAGGKDTYLIKEERDLEGLLTRKDLFNDYHELNYLAEEFIEGNLYHVDGIRSEGRILFVWPSIYVGSSLNCKDGKYVASHMLDEANPLVRRFSAYAESVLSALPTPQNMVFHLEAFIDLKDNIVLCEIASRAGGGGINPCWIRSFDINLKREHVRLQAGLPLTEGLRESLSVPRILSAEIMFAKYGGRLMSIPKECPFEFVESYKVFAEEGVVYKRASELAETAAEVPLIVGNSEEDLREKIQRVVDWFNLNTKWVSNE